MLTGGADRLATALHLLQEGRAPALLVSGVGGSAALADLVRGAGTGPGVLDPAWRGRVTLGRAATSTYGNAIETATWARGQHMRSLLVVTAYYHMPRALTELGRALPGATLYPVAVRPAAAHGTGQWRLLADEYAKWLVAKAGLSRYAAPHDPPSAGPAPTRARLRTPHRRRWKTVDKSVGRPCRLFARSASLYALTLLPYLTKTGARRFNPGGGPKAGDDAVAKMDFCRRPPSSCCWPPTAPPGGSRNARWTKDWLAGGPNSPSPGTQVSIASASPGGWPWGATRTLAGVTLRSGAATATAAHAVLVLSPFAPDALRLELPAEVGLAAAGIAPLRVVARDWVVRLPRDPAAPVTMDATDVAATLAEADAGPARRLGASVVHLAARPEAGGDVVVTASAQSRDPAGPARRDAAARRAARLRRDGVRLARHHAGHRC